MLFIEYEEGDFSFRLVHVGCVDGRMCVFWEISTIAKLVFAEFLSNG